MNPYSVLSTSPPPPLFIQSPHFLIGSFLLQVCPPQVNPMNSVLIKFLLNTGMKVWFAAQLCLRLILQVCLSSVYNSHSTHVQLAGSFLSCLTCKLTVYIPTEYILCQFLFKKLVLFLGCTPSLVNLSCAVKCTDWVESCDSLLLQVPPSSVSGLGVLICCFCMEAGR